MKKKLTIVFFIAHFTLNFAQITVNNTTFPAAGDTLRYAMDIAPAQSLVSNITAPGGNQTWDLTAVKPGPTTETIYKNASTGSKAASFSGAELVTISGTNETYYNVSATRFENMGYAGIDQFGLNLNIIFKLQPTVPERYSPMNFFDINQSTSSALLPFAINDLPDAIKSNIPGANLADSFRIRFTTQRLNVVDGWGTVKLPGVQYNVLREKRTEYRQSAIDVHTFLGWIPVPSGTPILSNLIYVDTTVTHLFYSNSTKEIVAQLNLNNEQSGLTSIRIKASPRTTPTHDLDKWNISINAYPNPAKDIVWFDFKNIPSEEYALEIFDITGKMVWREKSVINGSGSQQISLAAFKKGIYLYSLISKTGQIVGTKRLVVY
jgi:Secretion system C-terminal sorting domain